MKTILTLLLLSSSALAEVQAQMLTTQMLKAARTQSGMASFYSAPQRIGCPPYGRYNPNKLTAAHKTLPCGTIVQVLNKRNGKSVSVTINDRGPFVRGRIIDLSVEAAKRIDMIRTGVALVTITW